MKRLPHEMFWALAQHLERCGHSVSVLHHDPYGYSIHLSCGDVLQHEEGGATFYFPTLDAALKTCAVNKLKSAFASPHRGLVPTS